MQQQLRDAGRARCRRTDRRAIVESQAVALFQRRTERNAFPNTDRNAGRNAEPNADCKHRAWRPSNDG